MSVYYAQQAVNAYFLAPTRALAGLLPAGLRPLEARPQHGVLAITSFGFSASDVGPYSEVALSVLVPPWCAKDEAFPHAASFPFALATSTPASAADAQERWGLPRHPRPVEVRYRRDASTYAVELVDDGAPVLSLRVRRGPPVDGTRTYQLFTRRDRELMRVSLAIEGPFEERDDEGGELQLFDHPLAHSLSELLADDVPILEQCMEVGVQRFGVLTPHLEDR